jgi:hypothetical protein
MPKTRKLGIWGAVSPEKQSNQNSEEDSPQFKAVQQPDEEIQVTPVPQHPKQPRPPMIVECITKKFSQKFPHTWGRLKINLFDTPIM